MASTEQSNPLWKIIGGAVSGILLTWLYVRFGFMLPGIVRIGDTVSAEVAVATAEFDLYDPASPREVRQRALAIIVGEKPAFFTEIDEAIDHRFFDEVLRRKAVRKAKLLKHRDHAYDIALEKPALRKMYERRFGVTDIEQLKRKMFIADIARDELLNEYLDRQFPHADGDRRAEIVIDVYRNGLKSFPANQAAAADNGNRNR